MFGLVLWFLLLLCVWLLVVVVGLGFLGVFFVVFFLGGEGRRNDLELNLRVEREKLSGHRNFNA